LETRDPRVAPPEKISGSPSSSGPGLDLGTLVSRGLGTAASRRARGLGRDGGMLVPRLSASGTKTARLHRGSGRPPIRPAGPPLSPALRNAVRFRGTDGSLAGVPRGSAPPAGRTAPGFTAGLPDPALCHTHPRSRALGAALGRITR